MNYINEIKRIMKRRKITRYRVAKELDVSYITLNNWLNYSNNPSYSSLAKIDAWINLKKNQAAQ